MKHSADYVAFAGGTGHLGTRAGVCQRITNSAELLSTTPASQRQVRATPRRCDRSINASSKAESNVDHQGNLFG